MLNSRLVTALLIPYSFLSAQTAHTVPKELAPPSNQSLVFIAHGKGDQVYVCQDTWKLKAPDAKLSNDRGDSIGTHFAGPTWQASDGSTVKGKAVATVLSPDPNAVPWLLLSASDHSGEGTMTKISSIQRLNTKGGKAPTTGCDAARSGQELRVPYTADYYFYSEARQ